MSNRIFWSLVPETSVRFRCLAVNFEIGITDLTTLNLSGYSLSLNYKLKHLNARQGPSGPGVVLVICLAVGQGILVHPESHLLCTRCSDICSTLCHDERTAVHANTQYDMLGSWAKHASTYQNDKGMYWITHS